MEIGVLSVLVLVISQAVQVLSASQDRCVSYECRNGGTCISVDDTPSCNCLPGYFGAQCEYNSDPCYNYRCLNKGECIAPSGTPRCICPPGFSGLRCETQANGLCPELSSQPADVCSGFNCTTNLNCVASQICCASICGSRMCMAPDTNVTQLTCPGGCPPGYKCEYQPKYCPLGRTCISEMVPTCVEPNDNCGGCPDGQFCKDLGTLCTKLPCQKYQCVTMDACGGCPRGQKCDKAYPPCARPPLCNETGGTCEEQECKLIDACVPDLPEQTPKNACVKCQAGQVCKPTKIVCINEPCPSYECVPNSVFSPPMECDQTCGSNYICLFKVPDCPTYMSCSTTPVAQCVSRNNLLGLCPRIVSQEWTKSCLVDKYRPQCFNDMACNRSRQRCCPAQCGRSECTDVPLADNTPDTPDRTR
ncbi:nidogen and egf-like domain-containing protein 1 [Biomphalaria pfeifferi]|uniref:Nidogen and egf-like domain-containing protein 1 n=1 Tax=Biomphalaria pfeifferi TaxID=112525 RepID=A0AAD8B0H9_BIOPF|nr:nidogen and egf-like domain-containing protein 1 [Biomphalaria pfeifferi]